jgi:DNA sulfur modification protein DndC
VGLKMSNITRDTINGMIETVQNLYISDDIPWMIGYSGGKDSTAALQLVWMAIEGLPVKDRTKPIHIMNTDTLVESPVVSKWVEKSLEAIKKKAEEKELPFIPERLIPAYDNTFWVNLIGRGYPFPRMKYRWCTDRLKIQPVNNFIKNKIAEHGEVILVLGTRKQESTRRARTMINLEKKRVRELLSPNPTLANELVFSPLESWTDDDVWVFLMQYKNPWDYSNMDLMTMYRGATADNECPLMVDKSLPSCGKSRFGCWVCTMVESDKSMEAMIANDEEKGWMTPLLEFRNRFGNIEGDSDRRSFRRMQGNLQGSHGKLFHGPYKKNVREQWLRELLEIQSDINKNGPEDFRDLELIRIEELRAIRRIWVKKKHEFDDSLPRIYEEVIGKKFDDPEWIRNESFGKDEWDILKDVCERLYPNEELAFEMMYSIIDIENNATNVNLRKGILDSLYATIGKTFYKDEEDATAYYIAKMVRKKENGGKYNEKFLDYQTDASEYEESEEENS